MEIPVVNATDCSQYNDTNTTCFEFSETNYDLIVWFRTGLSSLAALMSLVAILVYSSKCKCTCNRKDFGSRLVLYLCIASFCNGVITAIQHVPVKLMCGHVFMKYPEGCIAAAFLIQYSLWTILALTISIGVYLFFRVKHYQDYEEDEHGSNFENSRCFEGVTLVLAFMVVPGLLSSVPFYKSQSLYGLSGAWCWIKTTDRECHKIKAGVIEQFIEWYGVNVVLDVVFIIGMIVIVGMIMRKKMTAADKIQGKYCRALADMCPLITYPAIFSLIYSLGVFNRIYYAATEKTVEWLWITSGIADTLVPIIVPFAFFLNKSTNCCQCPSEYEGDEGEPLILVTVKLKLDH